MRKKDTMECKHKWEEENKSFSRLFGYDIILKCTKCGDMKRVS